MLWASAVRRRERGLASAFRSGEVFATEPALAWFHSAIPRLVIRAAKNRLEIGRDYVY
jgi:hypothetical protein